MIMFALWCFVLIVGALGVLGIVGAALGYGGRLHGDTELFYRGSDK
jgi:hypothetical protein